MAYAVEDAGVPTPRLRAAVRVGPEAGAIATSHPDGTTLAEHPSLTEREVREGLEGNLCRCTGYHNIVKAVLAAAGEARA